MDKNTTDKLQAWVIRLTATATEKGWWLAVVTDKDCWMVFHLAKLMVEMKAHCLQKVSSRAGC